MVHFSHAVLDSGEVMDHLSNDGECPHPATQTSVNMFVNPSPPSYEPGGGAHHVVELDDHEFVVYSDENGDPVGPSMLCI